jgi:hypothetical protein
MINNCTYKADIQITTVMEKEILPLTVSLEFDLIFDETDPYHQAIALERIRFLINILFNDAIIGGRNNELFNQLKDITDSRFVECWDDPWDQFIAIMLYYKVSAILEGAGYMDAIRVSGDSLSPDLEFRYNTEAFSNEMIETDTAYMKEKKLDSLWYQRADTSTNEELEEMSWETLGLGWEKPEDKDDGPVLNNVKKFKPKIIK